jgi:hypothetical protein
MVEQIECLYAQRERGLFPRQLCRLIKTRVCVRVDRSSMRAAHKAEATAKAKGRPLLRDIALSIRFVEDLVRHPDRDSIIAALFGNCGQNPHFPHSSVLSVARASSLPSFQLPGVSPVAGTLKCPWSALFLWKIALPLKKILPRNHWKSKTLSK